MSSRTKINLILLGLTLILALTVTFESGQQPAPTVPLTELEPSGITQITIQRLAKADIRLQRQDAAWQLLVPIEIAANRNPVNTLLQLATKHSLSRYAAKELDLATYGLEPPLVTVVLNSMEINVGAPNPVTRRRYLKINDFVHLVNDDLYDIYSTEPAAYVATRLLSAERKIKHLSLPGLELSKTPSNHWEVSSGDGVILPDEPGSVIERWQNTSAQWVQAYDGAEPLSKVVVTLANGQTLHFIVTAIQPQLVMARPELQLQYHLSAEKSVELLPGWSLDTSPQ